MYDLIIIGLGPAGINACVYAKRSNLNILVIERGLPGGTIHSIKEVENYLGYDHISGSELAMKFYKQFKELKVPMKSETVTKIENKENKKIVQTNLNTYECKSVIIATGRGPQKLRLTNSEVEGISYCTLCDGALYKNKIVALYGSNPKALDDAIYLSNIVNKLYLVCNGDKLLGSEDVSLKVQSLPNIEIIYNEVIEEIIGKQKIEALKLKNQIIQVDGLFVNNEYGPITDFCKGLDILNNKDYIIVDEHQETKIKGIFACGDSTQKEIYQIITAASEGASAAINAYKYIKK